MNTINFFQDILESIPSADALALPTFKPNGLKVDYSEDKLQDDGCVNSGPKLPNPFSSSEVFNASITSWRRLTAQEGDCKAVYEVTFDVTRSNLTFKAGDTIGIIPHNVESEVNQVISHLHLTKKANLVYTLSADASLKTKIPPHVPIKSTLRHVLTHCVDLRSVLKKLFLLALSKYTKDETERRILEYICSKEGSIAYTKHILNKNICLLDIFNIFKSCKPTVEVLLSNLPRLLPRPYSIVNSGLENNDYIKICFSVMEINNRKGLTTGWLERIILYDELSIEDQMSMLGIKKSVCTKVPVYLRKNMNQFCLPASLEAAQILIGPGTGIAPFIGFLEEREILGRSEVRIGQTWVFFGCRNPKLDFIYEDELKDFLDKGTLTKLCTAYSRIETGDAKYIQDSLKQNGKELAQMINNGAYVFICGDLNTMVSQTKDVLIECLVDHANMSIEDAKKLLNNMQKDKKYIIDAWS